MRQWLIVAFTCGALLGPATRAETPLPRTLSEAGLYEDFERKRVREDALHFAPQYALWSDGASKRRWLQLPAGASIDASDPDVWKFPVGTRLWKEFSFDARRVETRLIERTPKGWRFAVYVWNPDESEASLAPEEGLRNHLPLSPGLAYDIPSVADCQACHEPHPAVILGFSAFQLSPDVDPNAPHAEERRTTLTLPTLVERGLVKGLPANLLQTPPRIAATSPVTRAALGYLHANCGNCHNARAPLSNLGLDLLHPVAVRRLEDEPALRTAVGRRGRYRQAVSGGTADVHVMPGTPELSTVALRMRSRNPAHQMPPLATKRRDKEAVALVERWIREELKPHHPPRKRESR